MKHLIVDTNVLLAAGGLANHTSPPCRAACASRLREATAQDQIYIDDGYEILREYQRYFGALKGQPNAALLFLKWLMTNSQCPNRITRVQIFRKDDDPDDFDGLPDGNPFDKSDRKFLAVAVQHEPSPAVLQATDSKWIGWRNELDDLGITVDFICEEELRKTYEKKSRKK